MVEKASDLIKDPVVLEFLGLEETPPYSQSDLETAIIDRLQLFLLELGKGYLFEARQKRFSFDDSHFFVDLGVKAARKFINPREGGIIRHVNVPLRPFALRPR